MTRRYRAAAPTAASEVRSTERGHPRIDPLGAAALVATLLGLIAVLLFLTSNPGVMPLR
jgi:hypothetical protein